MKKVYEYTMCTILGLSPLIYLITYLTYTEKIVMPILLVILGICCFKLRKEMN